jgi:hypothetical protein
MEPKHFAWGIIGIASMYVLSSEYLMQRRLNKFAERQNRIDKHIKQIALSKEAQQEIIRFETEMFIKNVLLSKNQECP